VSDWHVGIFIALERALMPRRKRTHLAGTVYHVVNRAAKRSLLFDGAPDYDAFERVLAAAVDRGGVALYAYCVMPNHWHLLLSPTIDGSLSRFMHWLTTTHARRWQISRGLDGQGAVYQGRFKDIPVSCDRHFLWVCRYVERNPLRASLVERAEEWRWSSLACRDGDRPGAPQLTAWPVARPDDWSVHLNSPQTRAEIDAFHRAIRTREPFGSEEWCRAFKARLNEAPPRSPGRRRRAECPQQMTPDPIHT
jgi:putative transposase